MHNGTVIKAAPVGASPCEAVTPEELALINTYTRRPLTAEEVYVFSVTLCDNDVDRDGERFPVESLFALEKLFVGKTGTARRTRRRGYLPARWSIFPSAGPSRATSISVCGRGRICP